MTLAKRFMGLLAAAVLLSAVVENAVPEASAQSLKIGYADAELVLFYLPEYKEIGGKVQQQLSSSQDLIQAKADEFQSDYEKFEKQAQLLPADKRADRETELSQRYQDLQLFTQQKEREVAQFEASLMNPLAKKVQDAVDAVAAEGGYDIVLKSPGILYVNPATITNITSDVAARLGLDLEAELSQNAGN